MRFLSKLIHCSARLAAIEDVLPKGENFLFLNMSIIFHLNKILKYSSTIAPSFAYLIKRIIPIPCFIINVFMIPFLKVICNCNEFST